MALAIFGGWYFERYDILEHRKGDDRMKIEIKDYTKVIRGNTVLDGINLTLESGVIYGLKGINGSGKTMLMRAICGLILPTRGNVVIDGKILGKDISFPENTGVLIENPSFLPNLTGFRNLKILADLQGNISEEQIRGVLSTVGLDPDDRRKFRKYSLGMKQKLGIAAAILGNPELIIVDEPLNALDADGVEMVHTVLAQAKARNALVILACHDAEELTALSDQIITIEHGRVTGISDAKEAGS